MDEDQQNKIREENELIRVERAKVTEEMDENIVRVGEEAIFKLNLPPMHSEIVKRIGSLRFRRSFSQNLLDHSIEVAQLMGIMAAELGVDIDREPRNHQRAAVGEKQAG